MVARRKNRKKSKKKSAPKASPRPETDATEAAGVEDSSPTGGAEGSTAAEKVDGTPEEPAQADAEVRVGPVPAEPPAAEDAAEDLDADLGDDEDVGALLAELGGASPVGPDDEPEVEVIDLDRDELLADAAAAAAPPEDRADRADSAPSTEDAPSASEPVDDGGREDLVAGADPTAAEDRPRASQAERGAVSTPEARDRLLAEALAHAEHRDARYRVPYADPGGAGRWKPIAAAVVFLLAATIAAAPPRWIRPTPPPGRTAAEQAVDVRRALLLQAEQVEAFRVLSQRLPESLDELTSTLPGIRYVHSGSRVYQLMAYDPEGGTIVYDSSQPDPAFEGLARPWVPTP